MSDPIGPGDWVECVQWEGRYNSVGREPILKGFHLTVGALYQIESLNPENGGLYLVGVSDRNDRGFRCSYNACCFRPIYRPKQEIIEALKAPPKRAPKRQREDA